MVKLKILWCFTIFNTKRPLECKVFGSLATDVWRFHPVKGFLSTNIVCWLHCCKVCGCHVAVRIGRPREGGVRSEVAAIADALFQGGAGHSGIKQMPSPRMLDPARNKHLKTLEVDQGRLQPTISSIHLHSLLSVVKHAR